jgi:hypothetical protein
MAKKHKGQIEISDLMTDAVSNAVARRDRAIEAEDTLTTLSADEVSAIAGGITSGTSVPVVKKPPIIAGFFPIPKPEVM